MTGRYEITERIAQGGMAEIYKGQALGADGFSKTVVIKRILPEYTQDTEFVSMFVHEAKLATRLDHPNIVQVFDLGKFGDEYFIIMEFVDGPNLHAAAVRAFKMDYRPFPLRECLFVVAEACKGLDYAHNKKAPDGTPLGIIHRDISPPNILLSFDGGVKVGDFGVAKARDQGVRTRTGVLKGKFGYMSPEQANGLPIDRRSDVFSLGVVLWELLAGKRLFKGQTPLQTVERVMRCEVPPLTAYTPDLPPEVDAIVQKALSKDLDARFQDCAELGDAISEYLFAAALKVSTRELSNLLRHMFLDARGAHGEPVWRPSPMPPPLRKPQILAPLTTTDDARTAITDVAAWEQMSGGPQGEVFAAEGTGGTRSAKYRGGTLLELNPGPIAAAKPEPSQSAPTVPASFGMRAVNVPIATSDAPTTRMRSTAGEIPIHVATNSKVVPAPPTASASLAGRTPSTATLPLTKAAPPAPRSNVMTKVWWTLGSIALAGAMAALIYFAKR